jgi:replicative DNA helicase
MTPQKLLGPSEVGWEPPVPLRRDPVPPFPLDVLPSKFQAFVSELARFTETAPDLASVLVLAAVAASVAGKVMIAPKPEYYEPLNIMCLIALPPGERKSAVYRRVFHPLECRERELQNDAHSRIAEVARQRDDLKESVKTLEKRLRSNPAVADEIAEQRAALEALPLPSLPRLLADDATPESIAPLMAANGGRLCVASAEGGIVAILKGRYSQGVPNIDVFLKGHAGDVIRVDRRNGESIIVQRPALTVALAVQPSVLAELANQAEFRGRGLVARFLFSLPAQRAGTRNYDEPCVPEPIAREYDGVLERLLHVPVFDPVRVLRFEAQALDAWLAFAVEVERKCAEGGELASIVDWISKLPGAVARLAGLLHMGDLAWREDPWNEPVSRATVERAISLGRYFLAHTRVALGAVAPDDRTKDAIALLAWTGKRSRFTVRQVQRSLSQRFERADDVRSAVAILAEHGYVRPLPTQLAGRGRPPTETFEVHPDLWADESSEP